MIRKRFVESTFCALLAALSPSVQAQDCEPQWVHTFGGQPGVDTTVRAMGVYKDGQNESLYLGGDFEFAGGIQAKHLARWDGPNVGWSPVGGGTNDTVMSFTVLDDGAGPALFVGGYFTQTGEIPANRIARWNGTFWSPLGSGVKQGIGSTYVSTLTSFDDGTGLALFAGGRFDHVGEVPANNIAKWDGHSWSALGSGILYGTHAMVVHDDGLGDGPALYVAGTVQVRKWNGRTWSTLNSGVNGPAYAMTVFDDLLGRGPLLYVGGNFPLSIYSWDGIFWGLLGNIESQVNCLSVFDPPNGGGPALIAGGYINSADGLPTGGLAKWDGRSWKDLDGGVNSNVNALTTYDDGTGAGTALYAGGDFNEAGDVGASRVAKWDGSTWSALGNGPSGPVMAISSFEDVESGSDRIVIGGDLTSISNKIVNRIAMWDGSQWQSLDNGVNSRVKALASGQLGDDKTVNVFAGGWFDSASGVPAEFIAKWNGQSWEPLGKGMSGPVEALAIFDDGFGPALVAGGSFAMAGEKPANMVAKWDGFEWSPLADGMNGETTALCVYDDGSGPALYAGGYFTTAGGIVVNGIAKWNGTEWSALDSGMNGYVFALFVWDDGRGEALYAGGTFSQAGGVSAPSIARWDGKDWAPVGLGTNGAVLALSVGGPATARSLYAAGSFTTAGGVNANRVAKWNGQQWSPIGDGVNSAIYALHAVDGLVGYETSVLAGGLFKVSPAGDSYLARWQECNEPLPLPGDVNGDGAVNITDLLAVIAAWGATGSNPADVTGDGTVNIADLLFVIANWG